MCHVCLWGIVIETIETICLIKEEVTRRLDGKTLFSLVTSSLLLMCLLLLPRQTTLCLLWHLLLRPPFLLPSCYRSSLACLQERKWCSCVGLRGDTCQQASRVL